MRIIKDSIRVAASKLIKIMKIALVSQNVSPGITTFRKELILELIERGHEVYALRSRK